MFAFYVDKTERTFYTNRKETYVLIFGRFRFRSICKKKKKKGL